MANNKVQAQEVESLNIHEAFFLKYKKAIIIAVVAVIVIIAGVFGYVSQISGPREDKASTTRAAYSLSPQAVDISRLPTS